MRTRHLILIGLLAVLTSCSDEPVTTSSTNSLVDITSQEHFDTNVQQGVSLVFYHASWCTKCAAQRPAVEGVSEDSRFGDVFFAEVEFEDFSTLVKQRGIAGFPTVVVYKNNEEQKRFTGQGHSQEELTQAVLNAQN
ncbi:MAG: thioredoxin family protein [Bacteroidia bacterium]|nr:thioredoxin family protein [Bacteroidia bacterium]